jgi:hypothetical protein
MHVKELVMQFEQMMSATAFAEEAQFDFAREILAERRKVLLVLTGTESDTKAARYAMNICKRIGAGLEILYITNDLSNKSALEKYLKELESKGIAYQITEKEGSLKEDIARFIDKARDIQFVVIDSRDLEIVSENAVKANMDEWNDLGCPVVLVSDSAKT